MAERRMFAKTIIDSDAFLDMPLSTQALYFHLSLKRYKGYWDVLMMILRYFYLKTLLSHLKLAYV
jgi:hypothetical protein